MNNPARLAAFVFLRLLPALLALAIPFLTPGMRDLGPFIGADWLRHAPDRYAGRIVWVRCFLSAEQAEPAPGDTLPVASLRDRRTSLGGRFRFLQGHVAPDGATLEVRTVRESGDELRGPFALELLLGGLVLAGFVVLFLRPAPGATFEVKPWIR